MANFLNLPISPNKLSPIINRFTVVNRLTVVSRGLIGGADTPGKGGWEFIPILTQNVGLLCGRNRLWGEGGGGGQRGTNT